MRYFAWMKLGQRTSHERLARMCFIDYDRQIALVAESSHERTGDRQIIGVGRLVKAKGGKEAEVAFLISDAYQGKGIGHEMMALLLDFARDEQLTALTRDIYSRKSAHAATAGALQIRDYGRFAGGVVDGAAGIVRQRLGGVFWS